MSVSQAHALTVGPVKMVLTGTCVSVQSATTGSTAKHVSAMNFLP